MLTITFRRPLSGLTSSTRPVKFVKGPSMTRTASPRTNWTLCRGFSVPSSTCCRIWATSASGMGVGRVPGPTNPVTFGVLRTRYQRSSDISIRIRT